MLPAETISAISDVVLALAGVTTAGVAIYGVKSWARELRGRATFEVARSLARATYRLRETIRQARSPLIRAYEFPEDYEHSAVSVNRESEGRAYAHIFSKRLAPVWTAYEEFDIQSLEAEALWGSDIREKTDKLRSLVRKLAAAAEAYIDNEASGRENFNSDKDFGRQIRSEVFAAPGQKDNELSSLIAEAVAAIENELRPHLRQA
jgi:hypothetical protein